MHAKNQGHKTVVDETSLGENMNNANSMVSQSNGLLTFIIVAGLFVAAVFAYKLIKKEKRQVYGENQNTSQNMVSEAMIDWFEKTLHDYAIKYSAYLLEKARLKHHLLTDEVKPLIDKYGIEGISPNLHLELEFSKIFPNADMDALKAMQKAWLEKKGISFRENSMTEAIAQEIEKNVIPNFEREFNDFVKTVNKILD